MRLDVWFPPGRAAGANFAARSGACVWAATASAQKSAR